MRYIYIFFRCKCHTAITHSTNAFLPLFISLFLYQQNMFLSQLSEGRLFGDIKEIK